MRSHSSSSSALGAEPGSSRLYLLETASPAAVRKRLRICRPSTWRPPMGTKAYVTAGSTFKEKGRDRTSLFRIRNSYSYKNIQIVVVVVNVERLITSRPPRRPRRTGCTSLWKSVLVHVENRQVINKSAPSVRSAHAIYIIVVENVETPRGDRAANARALPL